MMDELSIQREMLYILRCMEEHLYVLRKEAEEVKLTRERAIRAVKEVRAEMENE